ncbi:MAG: inorganic phosphate transporter [Cyclobacteriaceae bacterium]|jgi:PiT family inorganic phosphate transporter|nr:inorganic phosphate transporter [Cyclobacteriaceae bacterium]
MFELDLSHTILLIVCLIAACGFEFVNGFHDTANAVATVIYTNSLKPWVAVIWSGFCNFAGVLAGGIGVAMGIVYLLPVESLVDQSVSHSIAMVMALLISAITWNLATWYLGIPCSSSHTLIASILGVGIAYSLLPDANEAAVNWGKAQEIGISLLISPLFGFSMVIVLMFLLRTLTKNSKQGDSLFKEPKKNAPPPLWIRSVLILTCTGVSFFHGSNDGQKGVGLMMLILIGIVPGFFALNNAISPESLSNSFAKIETVMHAIDSTQLAAPDRKKLAQTFTMHNRLTTKLNKTADVELIPRSERFDIRKDIMVMDRNLNSLLKKEELAMSDLDKATLKKSLKEVRTITDFAPQWVVLLISISLGIGTMIGWKRIVRTIGEKIGKEHLTYAQGASAELVATSTIGISTYLGLPVSTTHVLSSGIAGSMVASKGIKNLQGDTVRNILIAWFLTLPVVLILSGTLFLLFRSFI